MRAPAHAFFLILVIAASDADARPNKKKRPPAPASDAAVLLGSPAALAEENRIADEFGLARFKDLAELRAHVADGRLVPIADDGPVTVDGQLGEHDPDNAKLYAHARPWVKQFLRDLAADSAMPAGAKFRVTSLSRTEEYQKKLRRKSAVAASGATPAKRSSHLTGSTVDISTKDMPPAVQAWLRKRLADMERRGLLQATEEKWGALCFHIMVRPDYAAKK
jgi:hypothetical protein